MSKSMKIGVTVAGVVAVAAAIYAVCKVQKEGCQYCKCGQPCEEDYEPEIE